MAFTGNLDDKSNTRKFDYDVYLAVGDNSDLIGEFNLLSSDSASLNTGLNNFISVNGFVEITKIERTTINANTEDGDTVDTNDGQTNILDKNGNFACSLLSVSVAAVDTLRALNRADVSFLLVSRCNKDRFMVFIPVATLKYNENFTSGDVLRLPISAMKQVSKTGDFVIVNEYTET